jgi:ribosomal protein S18 acetylase RimI-like enzyme
VRTAPVVEAARDDDLDAVLALWEEARSPYSTTPDNPEVLQRVRENDPGSLLVARVEGHVVGTVIAAWDGWRGNLYRLTVAPAHRREGIGLALVKRGLDHLRSRGAGRVTALVGAPDAGAARFWEAAGFPYDPVVHRHVRDV